MKIGLGTALLAIAFVFTVVIGYADADQQKNISFLSSYDNFKYICHKIGWEPKCRQQPIKDCSGKVIAFHAVLPKRLLNVPVKTIIKFEKVELNEGYGYDPNTGKFTAPVDGVYSFSWTYCTNKGSNAYLSGYVDGTLKAYISNKGQASGWKNTSGHLVVKLKKGSQFWVANSDGDAQLIHEYYTFLSGYKISGC